MREILRAEDLCADYGRGDVIHKVSFALKAGELCALLGSNGSGKTTLLRRVCGLLPGSGTVRLLGREAGRRERAGHMGYLSQGGRMALSLEVLDVVLMGFYPVLGLLESPGAGHRRRAMEILKWMGIAHLAGEPFQSLSQGQKQLCLFARTLVCGPELLVLDEPDSALDLSNRGQIFRLMKEYLAEGERAVLLCSHDVNAALAHAHRLLLMKEGALVSDLRPDRLSRGELEEALSEVYGPVEVLPYKDRYLMIGGDGT